MRQVAVFLLFAGAAAAQAFVPNLHAAIEGSTNNTIPFWNVSNTYQQIHLDTDVAAAFGTTTPTISSLTLRKDAVLTTSVAGRSLEAEISLGTTSVPPSGMTGTFATNIGASPTVVLPFTMVNLPSLTNSSVPNPAGWPFPFSTPYSYNSASGHLCWEMRHRNASISTTAPLDAWSPTSASVFPNIGLGCVATGQTLPAQIATRSLSITTGTYRNVLSRATASTAAVFLIGIAPQQITLPGLCSSLETVPIANIVGGTDAAGAWDLSIVFGPITGRGHTPLYGQFAFLDANLTPWSVGLSNATWMETPVGGPGLSARAWAAGSNAGVGFETATNGSVGLNYGLVTQFN